MENGKKYPWYSDSQRVVGYLPPKYKNLFEAYKKAQEMGNSELLNLMVRQFFDTMPPEVKTRILSKNHR